MCTTMRRLRRGTPDGMARKLAKRSITMRIKNLKQTMSVMKPWQDCSGIVAQLAALTRLRKAIKL